MMRRVWVAINIFGLTGIPGPASFLTRLPRPLILALIISLLPVAVADPRVGAASASVLITQLYAGGGNSGAPWRNDFVELRNIGSVAVDLTGWALHYAAATGTTWQRTPLSGSIAPGGFYLVQQAAGGAAGAPLPAPDLTGTVAMAATAGKVMLTRTSTPLTTGTSCPRGPDVVDLLGYGVTANCFEGAGPAPAPGSATAVTRLDLGCVDTDRNGNDFTVTPPTPRPSGTPVAACGAPTSPGGIGIVNPNPAQSGSQVVIEVAVTPGANPASTGLAATVDLRPIGGAAALLLRDDGGGGDSLAGDQRHAIRHWLPVTLGAGSYQLEVSIRDAEGRQTRVPINLTVVAPGPPSPVVISQLFAAGGNSGAPYRHDWVELFNRSAAPVDLAGWSLQYATASGAAWSKVDLAGLLPAGGYYLVQLGSGGPTGALLPTPDASAAFNLSSTAGKVVLARQTTLLSGGCPVGAGRADLLGYGDSATCHEGESPAPAPGTAALIRWGEGCRESDRNDADWRVAPPRPRDRGTSPFNCLGYLAAGRAGFGGPLPGSFLVYPAYSSLSASPRGPQGEETRLTLTNTSHSEPVTIRLFWVDGDGATTADSLLQLTPSQTTSFLASEIDPDISGYLLALAIDPETGLPVNFNHLIGDSYLRLPGGASVNLVAVAVQAIEPAPSVVDSAGATAELRFDDDHYQRLPATLAAPHLPPHTAGGELMLIVDRLEGSLVTGLRTVGDLAGLVYDDRETAHSFVVTSSRRQLRLVVADRTLRLTPRLSTVIPRGRSGWLKVARPDGGAIVGVLLDSTGQNGSARPLHALSMCIGSTGETSGGATLTIPLAGAR